MTRVLVATECSEEMQMQSSKLNSIVWNAVAGWADGLPFVMFWVYRVDELVWTLEVDFAVHVLLKVLVNGETNVKAFPTTYL